MPVLLNQIHGSTHFNNVWQFQKFLAHSVLLLLLPCQCQSMAWFIPSCTSIFCTEICCLHFAYLFLVCLVHNHVHTTSRLVRFSPVWIAFEVVSWKTPRQLNRQMYTEEKVARCRYVLLSFKHGTRYIGHWPNNYKFHPPFTRNNSNSNFRNDLYV